MWLEIIVDIKILLTAFLKNIWTFYLVFIWLDLVSWDHFRWKFRCLVQFHDFTLNLVNFSSLSEALVKVSAGAGPCMALWEASLQLSLVFKSAPFKDVTPACSWESFEELTKTWLLEFTPKVLWHRHLGPFNKLPRGHLSNCFGISSRTSFQNRYLCFPVLTTRTELRHCQVSCLSLDSLVLTHPHPPAESSQL